MYVYVCVSDRSELVTATNSVRWTNANVVMTNDAREGEVDTIERRKPWCSNRVNEKQFREADDPIRQAYPDWK